jgi:hypothetical protein
MIPALTYNRQHPLEFEEHPAMTRNKLLLTILCFSGLIPLSACNQTMTEFRERVGNLEMPSFLQQKPGQAEIVSMDGVSACPNVSVVQDLGALYEFTDMSRPEEQTLVSRADMSLERVSCVYSPERGSVAVQMTVSFDSKLGPRSKIYKGDRPNFAYPYFIAVSNPMDEIIAKEIFAASVSYESNQNELSYKETLRQIIPLDALSAGPDYNVLIGFQLTDDQLAYNRARAMPLESSAAPASAAPASAAPASPSIPVTSPASAPANAPTEEELMDLTEPL